MSRVGIQEIDNKQATIIPISPVQSQRRERRSVHVSRVGIEELDIKRGMRQSTKSNRKSLSTSSREELERLAKSIAAPMIPKGAFNIKEETPDPSEQTSDDEAEIIAAIEKLQRPFVPVRTTSYEEAGTASGECSEDGSVGELAALPKERAEDDSGKLGMSTVSLVLDDLKGDSNSG